LVRKTPKFEKWHSQNRNHRTLPGLSTWAQRQNFDREKLISWTKVMKTAGYLCPSLNILLQFQTLFFFPAVHFIFGWS
jgi:hypothetical protein